MEREILFRGKRLDNGEWEYGDLRQDKDAGACFISGYDYYSSETGLEREPFEFEVDPETVGEYTGKPDKNGTKIFEGDIVEIVLPFKIGRSKPIVETSEVYFDNGCFCINWSGGFRQHCRTRMDDFIPEATFEVIGNIHDEES